MSVMKDHQDAFGHEIYDYHTRDSSFEIIERDDGFITPGTGPEGYFKEFDEWLPSEQQAVKYIRGRVLDVGCGAGRVVLYLQGQGHDVTGIDNSPLAVETCRLRGVADARLLPITQVSKKTGTFDTIVMLGNNFGLVGSPNRARWLLQRFYNMTSSSGRIIAQTRDPYKTDDLDHLDYHKWNVQRGRPAGQLKIRVRYKKYITPWLDLLFISQSEMADLLEDSGWCVKLFLEDQQGIYTAILEKCA